MDSPPRSPGTISQREPELRKVKNGFAVTNEYRAWLEQISELASAGSLDRELRSNRTREPSAFSSPQTRFRQS